MNNKLQIISVLLIFVLLIAVSALGQELKNDTPSNSMAESPLAGEYLGQEPPGLSAKQFAPDIISAEGIQHCHPSFSPDGKEVYWMTIQPGSPPKIYFMQETDGKWTAPEVVSLAGEYSIISPVFSHDGRRLYFSSGMPGGYGKRDIWYVERDSPGWSEPINLGSPPNSEQDELQPSVTNDGTLYFISVMDNVQWNKGIYCSRFIDGDYATPEPLSQTINTQYADSYPCISPDESFLLFGSGRPDGLGGETNIYISFRDSLGNWSNPQNLGSEINNGYTVSFPYITIDGKYLFFNRFIESGTDAFFWIDSKILSQFKP